MRSNEKFEIRRRTARRNFWRQLGTIPELPLRLLLAAVYLVGTFYVLGKQDEAAAFADTFVIHSPLSNALFYHPLETYLIVGAVGLLILMVYPFGKKAAEDQLQSIGLVNHAGAVPKLIRKRPDKDHPRVQIWEFSSQSIPLVKWENHCAAIEAALDITIVNMKYDKGKSRILLYAVPAKTDLPTVVHWQDEYLSPDSFVLMLGEGYMGPVSVDLTMIPHILLGGSTGSGKSVLLKLLLMQSLQKGAEVYISDFKGGVDFPMSWHKRCRMCFDEQNLLELLTGLVDELQRRKTILAEAECANIDVYNRATGSDLRRIIFACDEVAEVMDKTGTDNDRKKFLQKIEGLLATIARQGRAFGIHLILATQRPDAQMIPGQIRNNLDCRICGRAEKVLSELVLDSTAAAEQIPKDARGRFLLYDGTVFQAFWFDEGHL